MADVTAGGGDGFASAAMIEETEEMKAWFITGLL